MVAAPIQPILVMPVFRGGERFERALASLQGAAPFFRRIVISLNSSTDSDDRRTAEVFRSTYENPELIELISTGTELPWMEHQYFWVNYLESTGAQPTDWIYWFAHDDELRLTGIKEITNSECSWPLNQGTIYLGPWAMRHDEPDQLYNGPRDIDLESWTSFPINGPTRLPVAKWIGDQLVQPTYINMSGCVTTLNSFTSMREFRVEKPGGMRIEMATAAAPKNHFVQEFNTPVIITYGCEASDRTKYAAVARKDDKHLVAWLMNYTTKHPKAVITLAGSAVKVLGNHARARINKKELPGEDWRYKETVKP
jgi:hypothetical protein